MNLFELFVKIGIQDEASDKLSKFTNSLGNGLKAAANVGVAAVSVAASGIAALTSEAVKNYAEYEQLVGGVETLFKDSSDRVQEYAANAYKTAGMSANDYMSTVTSFSASLLQSLEGDTEAAVEYANMAITDMSDNANKMGTDIEMIQNAYNGFAKGNFTMLDNLKLGYGGTKEEMQRLLDKANELKVAQGGLADLTIDSYADIVEAIHLVQTEMGITGTTAAEAAQTIGGSIASMLASWQNLLTGIADDNADFDKLVSNFVESVGTVFDNLLPRIQSALKGAANLVKELAPTIFEALPEVVNEVIPELANAAIEVVQAFVDGISENQDTLVESSVSIITTLVNGIIELLPQIIETGVELLANLVIGIAQALPELIPAAVDMVVQIVNTLVENMPLLIEAALELVKGLALGLLQALPVLIEATPELVVTIVTTIIENLPLILQVGVEVVWELIKGILQTIVDLQKVGFDIVNGLIDGLTEAWPNIVKNFTNLIESLIKTVKEIFGISGSSGSSVVFTDIGGTLSNGFLEGIQGIWAHVQEWVSTNFADIVTRAREALEEVKRIAAEASETVGDIAADNGTINSSLEGRQAAGKTAGVTVNNYNINSSTQTAAEVVKETQYINNRAVLTQ